MSDVIFAFQSVAKDSRRAEDILDLLDPQDIGFLRLTCEEFVKHFPDGDDRMRPFLKFSNALDRRASMSPQDITDILHKFFFYYTFGANNDRYPPDAEERVFARMALKWVSEIAGKLEPPAKAKIFKFPAMGF